MSQVRRRNFPIAAAGLAVLSLPAMAQNFSGTYSAPNQQGGTLTLTVR